MSLKIDCEMNDLLKLAQDVLDMRDFLNGKTKKQQKKSTESSYGKIKKMQNRRLVTLESESESESDTESSESESSGSESSESESSGSESSGSESSGSESSESENSGSESSESDSE